MIKSKKSVFAIVFAFIISICAIVLPFAMNKKHDNVYADEVSVRSNLDIDQTWSLPFTLQPCVSNQSNNTCYFLNIHFNLTKTVNANNHMNNVFTFNFDVYNYYNMSYQLQSTENISYIKYPNSTTNLGYTFNYVVYEDFQWVYMFTTNTANTGWEFHWSIYHDFDLDNILYCDVYKASNTDRIIMYQFVDVNNQYMEFWMPKYYSSVYNNFTSYRVYFMQSDTLMNNEFYQIGYDNGYNNGNSDGYNNGYLVGQVAGEDVGYQRGYTAGVLAGNDYTFIGLIGSVVDAPVKAFTGLLNFEILGVNLSAFVYGLISICLVITVIKVIKGGDR